MGARGKAEKEFAVFTYCGNTTSPCDKDGIGHF